MASKEPSARQVEILRDRLGDCVGGGNDSKSFIMCKKEKKERPVFVRFISVCHLLFPSHVRTKARWRAAAPLTPLTLLPPSPLQMRGSTTGARESLTGHCQSRFTATKSRIFAPLKILRLKVKSTLVHVVPPSLLVPSGTRRLSQSRNHGTK